MKHLVVDTFVPHRVLAGFELEFEAVTIVVVDCWIGLLAAPVLEQVAAPEFAAVGAGSVATGSGSVVLVVEVAVVLVVFALAAAAFVLAASSAPYCPLTLQLELQERICFESE